MTALLEAEDLAREAAASPDTASEDLLALTCAYPEEVLTNPALPLLVLADAEVGHSVWQAALQYAVYARLKRLLNRRKHSVVSQFLLRGFERAVGRFEAHYPGEEWALTARLVVVEASVLLGVRRGVRLQMVRTWWRGRLSTSVELMSKKGVSPSEVMTSSGLVAMVRWFRYHVQDPRPYRTGMEGPGLIDDPLEALEGSATSWIYRGFGPRANSPSAHREADYALLLERKAEYNDLKELAP